MMLSGFRSEAGCDADNSAKALNDDFRHWDCAPTVHESIGFNALGLALSEKQIPRFVENIGNQDKEWADGRRLWCFASRESPVRSRPRPPNVFCKISLLQLLPLHGSTNL